MNRVLSILFFSCAVFSIGLVGCKKSGGIPNPPTDIKVTASLQGRVVDETGVPVSNATVTAGTATATTNINGLFIFNNIQLNKKAGFLTVKKDGYIEGSRTINTNEDVVNYIQIQLIPKVVKGNFAAASGGKVDIESGSSVEFTTGSIKNAITNAAYTGTVNVIAAYLDPTDEKLQDKMPGALRGINTSSEENILETFGMLAIELEGSGGEKLQLATGKTATLTFPIPGSMLSAAPAIIPLWYFDETTGLWKEEGVANKVGTDYVGLVSHFSFWNVDVPSDFINLEMKLVDQNSDFLPNYKVVVFNTSNNSSGQTFTDGDGNVSILVPLGAPLLLKVFNKCGDIVYSNNIGPYTTDTDLQSYNIGSIVVCEEGAHRIFASIRKGIILHTAEVVFRPNYPGVPGEYINHLVVSIAIDDSLSEGITPYLFPQGNFYGMEFSGASPFSRTIGGKKVYTWTCTNTTVTTMSLDSNVAFNSIVIVFMGPEPKKIRVSLVDLSHSAGNNGDPFFSIGVNEFPYSVFKPDDLFFELISYYDNNGSTIQQLSNGDQIVTTNLEIDVDVPM